ncbi:MAG: LrgB family protein [Clostridia bacterium]|nr:LrgB family protein [Clostridia bacterium]
MNELFQNSLFLGMFITLFAYWIGMLIREKFKSQLLNPLLIAVVLVIGFLLITGTSYETYSNSSKYLSYLLTPATVSLAIPLYRRLSILKKNPTAIFISLASGVISCLLSIYVMCLLMGCNLEVYATIIPKSITTAIGLDLSAEIGGNPSLTATAICITGLTGTIFADVILKLFRITHPVAMGLAIGCSAHALGTTHAMELGEVQGAMSSLAIVITGLMTVILAPIFVSLPIA